MTIAVNPLTQLVYIAGNGVEVVDQRTNQPVATISVGQDQLSSISINPVTRKLYVTDYNTGMYVVDLTTNAVVGHFSLSVAPFLTYNPLTNRVYTLDNVGNIWVNDGTTGALIKEIDAQNPGPAFTITINPATNLLYIPLASSPGALEVVNPDTNAITTVPLQGSYSNFAAMDPVRNIIYISDYYIDPNQPSNEEGQVEVVNGATNTDTAVIAPIPLDPEALSVDPLTRRVYLSNAHGNVYVINGNTNTLSSTVIPVGTNPIYNTLDLAHGLLYVGNTAEFQPGTQSVSVVKLR